MFQSSLANFFWSLALLTAESVQLPQAPLLPEAVLIAEKRWIIVFRSVLLG